MKFRPTSSFTLLSLNRIEDERMWATTALEDPALMQAYIAELERISTPGYVDSLRARFGDQWDSYHASLKAEYSALGNGSAAWDDLSQ